MITFTQSIQRVQCPKCGKLTVVGRSCILRCCRECCIRTYRRTNPSGTCEFHNPRGYLFRLRSLGMETPQPPTVQPTAVNDVQIISDDDDEVEVDKSTTTTIDKIHQDKVVRIGKLRQDEEMQRLRIQAELAMKKLEESDDVVESEEFSDGKDDGITAGTGESKDVIKRKHEDINEKSSVAYQCPICRDRHVDFILTCGHPICTTCASAVSTILKEERPNNFTYTYNCPVCRKKTSGFPIYIQ